MVRTVAMLGTVLWVTLPTMLVGCGDAFAVRTVYVLDDSAAGASTVPVQPIQHLVALPPEWNNAEIAFAAQLPNEAWVVANASSGEVVHIDHDRISTIVSFGLGPNELETVNDILVAQDRFYVADYDWTTILLEFDMDGEWRSRIDLGPIGLTDAVIEGDTLYGIRSTPYFGSGLGLTPGLVLFAVDIGGKEPELIWESMRMADIRWAQSDPELLAEPGSIASVEITSAGIVTTESSVYYVNYPNYHVIEFDQATGSIVDEFRVRSSSQDERPTVILLESGSIRIKPYVQSLEILPGGDICIIRFPRVAEETGEWHSRVDVFSRQFDFIGSTETAAGDPMAVFSGQPVMVLNPFPRTVKGALSDADVSAAARESRE